MKIYRRVSASEAHVTGLIGLIADIVIVIGLVVYAISEFSRDNVGIGIALLVFAIIFVLRGIHHFFMI